MMADFCKQCSIEIFNEDFRGLAGLNEAPLEKGFGVMALCEGCGPTTVNEEGECIDKFCEKHGDY